jgi:hypothetical protein
MKRHLRRIEKDLHNDYIIKYPFEKLTNRPKLEKITPATNLNNKSLGNIYKTDKSDEIKDRMRVIYLYYLKIFG